MAAAARLRSRACAVGERRFGGWCVRTLRTRCTRTHLRPSVSTRCFLQLERRTALRTNCCSELASHPSRKLAERAAYDAFHDDSDATAQSARATIVHGPRGSRLCALCISRSAGGGSPFLRTLRNQGGHLVRVRGADTFFLAFFVFCAAVAATSTRNTRQRSTAAGGHQPRPAAGSIQAPSSSAPACPRGLCAWAPRCRS